MATMAVAAVSSLYVLVQKQQPHLCRLAAETLGFVCSHGELHSLSVRRGILKVRHTAGDGLRRLETAGDW